MIDVNFDKVVNKVVKALKRREWSHKQVFINDPYGYNFKF